MKKIMMAVIAASAIALFDGCTSSTSCDAKKSDCLLFKSEGIASEKTGWRLKRSEAGKIVYIPFEGYYESKGGRIESQKIDLKGAKYCKMTFKAKAEVDGLWWVDLFDEKGNLLPDMNSRLYQSEEWKEYSVVVPVIRYAKSAQLAFVSKKGVSVKDVTFTKIPNCAAAKWCDDFYATLPQLNYEAPASSWDKLPNSKEKLISGKTLRIVLLGDSIMNDTYCGNLSALVQREFPNVEFIISVRGSTGCWYYYEKDKFEEYVTRHNPDLVIIGGISNNVGCNDDVAFERMVTTIERAKAAGIEVCVATPPPSYEWRTSPDDVKWNEEDCSYPPKNATRGFKYFRRGYQEKAVKQTGVTLWNVSTPPGKVIANSRKPLDWFKRDAAHNDDRGKQLIARTMLEYFRAAKKK